MFVKTVLDRAAPGTDSWTKRNNHILLDRWWSSALPSTMPSTVVQNDPVQLVDQFWVRMGKKGAKACRQQSRKAQFIGIISKP